MNYLTIIAVVWTVCALCAVFFIRGASQRNQEPLRVQSEHDNHPARSKDFGRTL